MALRYYLNEFAQGPYDDDPVRNEVQFEDTLKPDIRGTFPSQPVDGAALGPAWTVADLCAALSKQLGVKVEVRPKPE